MEIFQIIPIAALIVYFLYLSYYYAAPMFWLRVLLLIAYKKYRCTEVRIGEETVTARYPKDGGEGVIEQPIGEDLVSRFFAMSLCSALRAVLAELRKETA